MTTLSVVQSADFTSLQRITGLSADNLSNHLAKLEEGKLVQVAKGYLNKRPNTTITITQSGKQAIEVHWRQLKELHEDSQNWNEGGVPA